MANLRPVVLTLLIVVLSAASAASAFAQGSGATPEVVATGPSPVEFVWEIGGGSEPFAMPIDVSIDPEGNLWVLDMAHHQFQIFSPDGEFLESWGSMGEDDGEFRFYEGRSPSTQSSAVRSLSTAKATPMSWIWPTSVSRSSLPTTRSSRPGGKRVPRTGSSADPSASRSMPPTTSTSPTFD